MSSPKVADFGLACLARDHLPLSLPLHTMLSTLAIPTMRVNMLMVIQVMLFWSSHALATQAYAIVHNVRTTVDRHTQTIQDRKHRNTRQSHWTRIPTHHSIIQHDRHTLITTSIRIISMCISYRQPNIYRRKVPNII